MQSSSSIRCRLAVLAATSAALLALGALAAPGVAAARDSRLILQSSGVQVEPGSPAYATVRFGACGTILAAGTLANNDGAADIANFTEGGGSGGGCGEGGPSLEGVVTSLQVTHRGKLSVFGEMVYITREPKPCTYALTKLTGTFAVPGSTTAAVSGVGKRVGSSKTGCARNATLEGVEATLGSTRTGPAFEAVLG